MSKPLKQKYVEDVVPSLTEEFKLSNRFLVPRLEKIVINTSINTVQERDKDMLNGIADGLSMITGQRPIMTKAKTSVSNFKLREGMVIGAKVTLRGNRMYEFLDRLINIALPRIRDFRGIKGDAFDGRGNYNLGIQDQTIFPEINPDKINTVHGMDIAFVTSTDDNKLAKELLKQLGMPFVS